MTSRLTVAGLLLFGVALALLTPLITSFMSNLFTSIISTTGALQGAMEYSNTSYTEETVSIGNNTATIVRPTNGPFAASIELVVTLVVLFARIIVNPVTFAALAAAMIVVYSLMRE